MERIAVGEDAGLVSFRLQDPQHLGVLGERVLAFESGRRDRNERAEHHGCCDGDAELCHCPLHPWWLESNPSGQSLALMSIGRDQWEKVQYHHGAPPKIGVTFFFSGFPT